MLPSRLVLAKIFISTAHAYEAAYKVFSLHCIQHENVKSWRGLKMM